MIRKPHTRLSLCLRVLSKTSSLYSYSLPHDLRPRRHARNHRRSLGHCPRIHLPRSMLYQTNRSESSVVLESQVACVCVCVVWDDRDVYIVVLGNGEGVDA